MVKHTKCLLKVLVWLSEQKIGKQFIAMDLGKTLNLTSGDVAHYVRMADCCKIVGKTKNNSQSVYEVVRIPESPKCPMNLTRAQGRAFLASLAEKQN
jgi:hypothetical protein